jgi:hypothetical protein
MEGTEDHGARGEKTRARSRGGEGNNIFFFEEN